MAMFKYWFAYSELPNGEPMRYVFYDTNEKDARKQFFETFGVEAGALIERENW